MRSKYIDHLLKRLVLILCSLFVSGINSHPQTNAMSKELPSSTLLVPQNFRDVNDIKAFFDRQGVPVEVNEVRGREAIYCFITAHPYSGIDTTDLYCFLHRGERLGWGLFLKAFLWKTPFTKDLEFKLDGDSASVICKGKIVLRITPPQ